MNKHHSQNQTQEHNDNQIERVLNALRDTMPPAGMDRRILNILETHTSQKGASTSKASSGSALPSEAKRSRGTPAFSDASAATFLRWTTTAAIAALFIATLITLTTNRRAAQPSTATATHTTPIPAKPITAAITMTNTAPYRTTAPAHVKLTQPQFTEATQVTEDAQLSHPAPPIPITDQERVLLRYTSRGRTEDLAQISNDRKAAKDQQEAAEFTAFFTPPPPPNMTGESE